MFALIPVSSASSCQFCWFLFCYCSYAPGFFHSVQPSVVLSRPPSQTFRSHARASAQALPSTPSAQPPSQPASHPPTRSPTHRPTDRPTHPATNPLVRLLAHSPARPPIQPKPKTNIIAFFVGVGIYKAHEERLQCAYNVASVRICTNAQTHLSPKTMSQRCII